MTGSIDPNTCALCLRSVTDQVAVSFKRPDPDATLAQILTHIQAANAWANTELRESLQRRYPDIGWSEFDEDDSTTQTRPSADAPYWVYDPIDGAYHTMQGLPLWSASLALISGGKTVFGAVYDPTQREMFLASQGGGASLNGRPIRPVGKTHLTSAIVATFLAPPFAPSDPERHQRALDVISRVSKSVFVMRQMTSASLHLAYVASGRLDALVDVTSTPHDWLAGALLVSEAGLSVTDLSGAAFGWEAAGILAASVSLRDGLLAVLGTK